MNDLRAFFDRRAVEGGKGIWKWHHYFDIYDRHFDKFRCKSPNVLEVGVYGGGSLEMWYDYFGPGATIYGVDKQKACKKYANDHTKIFIGDQGDLAFWQIFCQETPRMDIVIDDGSHIDTHQWDTFASLICHINDGGVYLCEDVHNHPNAFASRVFSVASELNSVYVERTPRGNAHQASNTQRMINSVHFYPYVVVVEKNETPVEELVNSKNGTEWTSFL